MRLIYIILFLPFSLIAQNTYQIATLKYNGGGDWYANPTGLPNLIEFANKNIGTRIQKESSVVEAGSIDIFNYPFIYMTGHGNVSFNNTEADNLRKYLLAGGFLHIDDNYGMDPFIRKEMKKIFPNNDLIELPNNHPIFNGKYKFKNGIPKIHQHDGKHAKAYGIIYNGRLVCLYSYESDLGDGWEDQNIHNNSSEKREKALQMGCNIIEYVFEN